MFVSNRAIRPVEESMARQRRFVADASHELKTPIAVIAANAEAASGAADEKERSVWIENITDETNRMNELVDSLLSLAKAEEKPTDLVSFDLSLAVSEETDSIEAFFFEKDIELDIKRSAPESGPLEIVSDKAKVQAIISVLLENALKYTPFGGRVQVSVSKGSVSVSNTGEYMPPEVLGHLFDRFYRADLSRNSETGGHGIGLSIAKEIATALGAELKVASALQEDGGAVNTFTLSL
jgi:signal transduction histidine kinase